MLRPMGQQPHPFGLQAAPPQGAHQVRQPLRPVAQGEPPPVSQQAGRGAAQLLKGAVGLPGLAPVPAVSRLEVGGIGDDQVEPASRQGHLPPVRLEDRPLQAAVDQVLPGTLGRPLLPLHSREREPPLPGRQHQEQTAAPRPFFLWSPSFCIPPKNLES